MTMGPYYRGSSDSVGLYGSSSTFGGTYFEWFVFQVSNSQPATPTDGSWSFTTNSGTPPTGWSSDPPVNPSTLVWVSIANVNSKNTNALVWSTPGQFAGNTATNVSGGTANVTSLTTSNSVKFNNLPTSASGLTSGSIWKDTNGFLRIV